MELTKEPFFTIIIPLYKGEAYIEEALESVKKQTFKDFECILVSDGSPGISLDEYDNCENIYNRLHRPKDIDQKQMGRYIFERVVAGDSRFKFYEKENGGQGSARNYAIERTKGNFLIFLDNDDYFTPNHLQAIYEFLKKDEKNWYNTIYYFEDYQEFMITEGEKKLLPQPTTHQRAKNIKFMNSLIHKQLGLTFGTIHRDVLGKERFTRLTKGMEDVEIIHRIYLEHRSRGKTLKYLQIPISQTVMKRVHAGSFTFQDVQKGHVQEYTDMKNTYKNLLQNYKLSFAERAVCNLGILRFSINPSKNLINKYLQKSLSFCSKMIGRWYF
jgi:glycosyltransferase involved in cell wall biosynthesis